MTFHKGREENETMLRQSTFTICSKHPFKVKAKLDSKSFRFSPTRILLSLYDYRLKHLAVMEEQDRDVITTLQVDGLAQLFGSEELESRMTPFQEGEDDEDMIAQHVLKHEENSLSSTSDYIHGPPTGSRAKKIQEQVNLFLVEINFDIFENVVLPKCSTLVIPRHTNKEEDVTLHQTITEKNGPTIRTSTVKNGPSDRTVL